MVVHPLLCEQVTVIIRHLGEGRGGGGGRGEGREGEGEGREGRGGGRGGGGGGGGGEGEGEGRFRYNMLYYLSCFTERIYRYSETQTLLLHTQSHLVQGEPDAKILQTHLLLLAAMFLHECDEARALPVSIAVLLQFYDELRVRREGRVVTTTAG